MVLIQEVPEQYRKVIGRAAEGIFSTDVNRKGSGTIKFKIVVTGEKKQVRRHLTHTHHLDVGLSVAD